MKGFAEVRERFEKLIADIYGETVEKIDIAEISSPAQWICSAVVHFKDGGKKKVQSVLSANLDIMNFHAEDIQD